ncbi:MAG: hypothetical protein KME55_35280 [Nostoc indistinguendum CM1-VF10]|nr:hypothetical protein [Nostoc indistinguendum CM1-VF10]
MVFRQGLSRDDRRRKGRIPIAIFKTANQFLRVSFCSTADTVGESTTYL